MLRVFVGDRTLGSRGLLKWKTFAILVCERVPRTRTAPADSCQWKLNFKTERIAFWKSLHAKSSHVTPITFTTMLTVNVQASSYRVGRPADKFNLVKKQMSTMKYIGYYRWNRTSYWLPSKSYRSHIQSLIRGPSAECADYTSIPVRQLPPTGVDLISVIITLLFVACWFILAFIYFLFVIK